MAAPKTFIDVIDDLKSLSQGHADYAASMEALAADTRYSHKEREMVKVLAEYARHLETRLKEITTNVGTLAVAHSNIPFDEVIKAVGK